MKEDKLFARSKEIRQDNWGRLLCYISVTILLLLVVTIVYFISSKGLQTFTKNHVNVWSFLTTADWNTSLDAHGHADIGALALITTSFSTTMLAAAMATPLAFVIAIYVVALKPKFGQRFVQPVIELLLGIPSVVYGFIGLTVLVPIIRGRFGGTGFGILAGALILALMILPTITSLSIESLRSVDPSYQKFAYTLGCTHWQMIYHVMLRISAKKLMIAVIYGIARAFGEALAVQMVIGNTVQMPTSLVSPTATLTSKLTTDIGNTIDGTLPNNALWTLALILLLISLAFNLIVKGFTRGGEAK
ncbi:phosphate ABC transporter permease subunit PstC [Lapidilactobacillus luobeiensis]|uniref:phosphate ABC transporter permease subunit PstC n=1 Tax=Lapidilactobacillus luobeiensis TaxID=2950371 RepID=UPI0021C29A53|nr:phosphate ABC transporter permease subunit PstC [Lapidilactobacillus luobeiensis]